MTIDCSINSCRPHLPPSGIGLQDGLDKAAKCSNWTSIFVNLKKTPSNIIDFSLKHTWVVY